MGVRFKHWSGGIALATLVLTGQGLAMAQDVDPMDQPLDQPTISSTLDQQSKLNGHFETENLGGDARFLLGFDTPERAILNSAMRIEIIYKDLLQQQDDDFPTMRTRDLASPYDSSVSELQSFSGIGNSESAPASQSIPPAAPSVPALW